MECRGQTGVHQFKNEDFAYGRSSFFHFRPKVSTQNEFRDAEMYLCARF